MAKEIIKEIKGFDDYYISNLGIAYTTKVSPRYNPTGEMRVLKARNHPSGYQYLGLFKGKGPSKQRIWKRVHRVVWETFNDTKIPNGLEIDHKDANKSNNKLSNLRMVTHSENMIAAFERRKKLKK